ncbi:hypothetical protein HDG41_001464 [Paraburkholderia sp. JPY162]|uniref:Uncharacterized protein n=1 Tax=Paraburkholderia youngii TaxID=2782701 RepID=A0A7W8L2Z0_9BURK|nr:hypothetical protein [Paraburkholderia youngii]
MIHWGHEMCGNSAPAKSLWPGITQALGVRGHVQSPITASPHWG